MKNIQQQIDIVSRLPDDVLLMKAQRGDPSIPQWAFVTEIDDRTRARKESEANQQSQPKVADRVVQEGIAMLQPQGQPMAMQQPMQQPMQGMYAGGAVRMNEGRMSPCCNLKDSRWLCNNLCNSLCRGCTLAVL